MSPKTILLVEDDPEDAELTIRALKDVLKPYALKVARDGVEAAELLSDEGGLPVLILLDLNLPRVNGMELLEQLNQKWGPELRGVTVAILSSSFEGGEREAARKLGARTHIRKPISLEQTAVMVREVSSLLRGA